MKKRWGIFLAAILVVTCLWGCQKEAGIAEVYVEENYILDVQLAIDADKESVRYTTSSNSHFPITLREVLILSAYDAQGQALAVDGSSYSQSSLTVSPEDDRQMQKHISHHQVTYVSEYVLDGESFKKGKQIAGTRDAAYGVAVAEGTAIADAIVRLDVLLLGKPQEYPYADWEVLDIHSQLLQGEEKSAAEAIAAQKTALPNNTMAQSYAWDVYAGKALLLGRGSVQDTDLLIPNKIRLTKTADGYCEDPIYGVTYDVVVGSDAFFGCKDLKSVTFEDGVRVENDSMCSTHGNGMFQNCTALIEVRNLPDTVASMENTFFGCAALETTPEFPTAVLSMKQCFRNCAALQTVMPLPASVTDMTGCFYECKALKEVPALPDGVEKLAQCFVKCTLLEEVPALPDSIEDMAGTFSFCTNLKRVETLPASLKKLSSCFRGCTQLTKVPAIPDGTEDMAGSFYSCQALTQIPWLPDSVTNMDGTFENCTGITKLDRWPSSVKKITGCFRGCTNLVSVPETPKSILDTVYLKGSMYEAFFDCDSLEQVTIYCCDRSIFPEQITNSAKVNFGIEHKTEGLCEGCNCISGMIEVEGITCYVSNMPKMIFDGIQAFLKRDLPDTLKSTCKTIVFTTEDIDAGGLAVGGFSFGYMTLDTILVDASEFCKKAAIEHLMDIRRFDPTDEEQVREVSADIAEYYNGVICHELGHCYDYHENYHSPISASDEFMEVFPPTLKIMGTCLAHYSEESYPEEVFARSVAGYFVSPKRFQQLYPEMYAFLESLFGPQV